MRNGWTSHHSYFSAQSITLQDASIFSSNNHDIHSSKATRENLTHWVIATVREKLRISPKQKGPYYDRDSSRCKSRAHGRSQSELSLLSAAHNRLLPARLANLVGADPLTLDGPGPEALVVGVVPSEVAVLDQTSAGMSAVKVDDFELAWSQ